MNSYIPTVDLFHFLTNILLITPESKKLQKKFEQYENEHFNDSYLQDMEKFAKQESDDGGFYTVNSYNDENDFSQTIQYVAFEKDNRTFVILQIHGGADVRGGYTKPYIFEVKDLEELLNGASDIQASIRNGKTWYTDDGGNTWYSDDENPKDEKFPNTWEIREDGVFYKPTGEPINFTVLGIERPQWWESNQRLVARWAPTLDPRQTTLKTKKRLRA
ncbi:MAG: hypothetical protein QXN16_00620 [Candidatus Micrarchaeaceae archaeon]